MDGMMMMLSKMIGITPDELKGMSTRMQQGLEELGANVAEIRDNSRAIIANQILIMEKLEIPREEIEHGRAVATAGSGSNGNPA